MTVLPIEKQRHIGKGAEDLIRGNRSWVQNICHIPSRMHQNSVILKLIQDTHIFGQKFVLKVDKAGSCIICCDLKQKINSL